MSRASRRLAAAAALAGLGCGDIGAPVRSDLYEWRIEAPAVPGPGLDTLSFHWGKNEQPVRIWVEDASGLPDHMARAIEVWESSFLYGEFDGTLVGDSAQADVIVRGGAPDAKLQRLRLHSALRPECTGVTDIDIDVATHQLRLPMRLFIDRRLLCVGCPIAPFHTLTDVAREHGVDYDDLLEAVLVIANAERATIAQASARPRSGRAHADRRP